MSIPAGGSATINGVVYQMLWCLLRTARLHAEGCSIDEGTGQVVSAILKLEPTGGGGDVQEIGKSGRIVEQLKARPDGGAWSLREVVEAVIPDLYSAVDSNAPGTKYRFVTEGRMGSWAEVHKFFESLKRRQFQGEEIPTALDDTKPLRFRKKPTASGRNVTSTPFWTSETYTERSLFERIVQQVRSRRCVEETESIAVTRKKLWELLAHFEFDGGRTAARLQSEVDSLLLELVDFNDQLPQKRDSMLFDLARLASRGNADIEATEFLREHGLDSTPLSELVKLREKAREVLNRRLDFQDYDRLEDVRDVRAESVVADWPRNRPILLLRGGSGQGKSWLVAGVAQSLAAGQDLVLLIRARGNADTDLTRAADLFWQNIKGNDTHLPLAQIARRRRQVLRTQSKWWLTVLIDGVQEIAEARDLVQQPWEDWGVRLVVACDPEIASTVEREARDRCFPVEVGDFALSELQEYLGRRLGDDWPDIPTSVRNMLRRPLLARLYCDVARDDAWSPTNEYTLFSRYWDRLYQDEQTAHRLDAVPFKKLALSILEDKPYPWTETQVLEAGLDNQAVARLCRVGWLRPLPRGRYEIWHDRLLNWAVAQGLEASVTSRNIEPTSLFARIRELYSSHKLFGGRFLGEVPVDFLWLLMDSGLGDLLNQAVESLLQLPYDLRQKLFSRDLPTLGPHILPALFRALEAVGAHEDPLLPGTLVESITGFDASVVAPESIRLLGGASPYLQRAAMRILAHRPSERALNRLWELHVAMQADPTAYYLQPNEGEHTLYRDSFNALRACVRLNPTWLEGMIQVADSGTDPVADLAYLLANLDCPEIWGRCKPLLFAKVDAPRERSLASNISRYRDSDELPWLLERIHRDDNLLGPWALRALIRIDPKSAVRELGRLPALFLGPTKSWCFSELLAREPETVRQRIFEMIKTHTEPWRVAEVYRDDADALDTTTLDFLLHQLEILLDSELTPPSPPNHVPLFLPLTILSLVHRLELIECFERKKGSSLEEKLRTRLLAKGPRRGPYRDCVEREPAVAILYKIGGRGFSDVINSMIDADNRYGRFDGLKQAIKRPDQETINRLIKIARQDELWDDHAIEQSNATEALAALGLWSEVIESVIRWGTDVSRGPADQRQVEGEGPLDDKTMAAAIEMIERGGEKPPGVLLAFGLGGRTDFAEKVRIVAEGQALSDEVALAGVLTLGRLAVGSTEIVTFLERQLTHLDCRYHALVALSHIDTPAAREVLFACLRKEYVHHVALHLLLCPQTRTEASRLIRQHLDEVDSLRRMEMIEELLVHLDARGMPEAMLEITSVREFLQEQAFSDNEHGLFVGSRIVVIRALMRVDPIVAALAARKGLANLSSSDRVQYPYLLLEIGGPDAVAVLLDHALVEKSIAVTWSIGRALGNTDLSGILVEWLTSDDSIRRKVACRLLERIRASGSVANVLLKCLDDADERVSEAAREALILQRDARETDILVSAIREERSESRRWVLLDSLLEIGDVGDMNRPWPAWASSVGESFGYSMQAYLIEQLDARRNELFKEAEERDKRSEG